MSRFMTSSTLIDSIKRRALLPSTQVTFLNVDFLQFATEELDMAIIPYVMQYHQDYFLTSIDIPIVGGQNRYPIPYRAIGNKLRDVAYIDNRTNDPNRSIIYEMTRVSAEDISFYQNNYSSTILRTFYMENDEIVMLPQDMTLAVGSLRVFYYIRPSQLVDENRFSVITAINTTTGEITVDSIPDNITTGVNLDLIKTQSPHKALMIDIQATTIDTINNVITLNPDDLPVRLMVGDRIGLAEESCIPQIPTDLHSMLAQRVACRCLEALGDQAGLQAANAKLTEMEAKGASLVQDRVEGAPMKINNRHGFLNRIRSSFRS